MSDESRFDWKVTVEVQETARKPGWPRGYAGRQVSVEGTVECDSGRKTPSYGMEAVRKAVAAADKVINEGRTSGVGWPD